MEQVKGNYVKSLKVLHTALLAGQVIFLVIMLFFVVQQQSAIAASLDKTLQVAALLFSFGGILAGSRIFNSKLAQMNTAAEDTAHKAAQYRAANIVRWAMIEGPCLFVIICFFISGNYSFAALALALIVYFFLMGPSRIKTMLQLQLSDQQVDDL